MTRPFFGKQKCLVLVAVKLMYKLHWFWELFFISSTFWDVYWNSRMSCPVKIMRNSFSASSEPCFLFHWYMARLNVKLPLFWFGQSLKLFTAFFMWFWQFFKLGPWLQAVKWYILGKLWIYSEKAIIFVEKKLITYLTLDEFR